MLLSKACPGANEVEILGIKDAHKTVCTGVEMFKKSLNEGQAGDNCGLLLRGLKRDQVQRGQVLCKPGTITPHKKFEAEIYVLNKEEGGRHTPFFSNYRPQFFMRTADITGTITLPEGTEMVSTTVREALRIAYGDDVYEEGIEGMDEARVTEIAFATEAPKGSAQIVVGEATACIPLGDLIDFELEIGIQLFEFRVKLKKGLATDVPMKATRIHVKNREIGEQIIEPGRKLNCGFGVQPDGRVCVHTESTLDNGECSLLLSKLGQKERGAHWVPHCECTCLASCLLPKECNGWSLSSLS